MPQLVHEHDPTKILLQEEVLPLPSFIGTLSFFYSLIPFIPKSKTFMYQIAPNHKLNKLSKNCECFYIFPSFRSLYNSTETTNYWTLCSKKRATSLKQKVFIYCEFLCSQLHNEFWLPMRVSSVVKFSIKCTWRKLMKVPMDCLLYNTVHNNYFIIIVRYKPILTYLHIS